MVLRGVIMMFPYLLFLSLGIVLLSDFLHVLLQTEPHQLCSSVLRTRHTLTYTD